MASELWTGLLGIAGGGTGATIISWLRDRRRLRTDDALGVTDVASRYWKQIEHLEHRLNEQSQRIVALQIENTQLQIQVAQLKGELERVK